MIDLNSFASDPAAIFYLRLLESYPLAFDRLFELLNDSENELSMINTSTFGRPALDGVVVLIEADHEIQTVLETDSDGLQFRRAVGVVVRLKMEELGWQKDREETPNVTNSTIFKSSQLYILNPEWTADGTTSCCA